MRFFVPAANDPVHAQTIYAQLCERVGTNGKGLANRRIYRIRFSREGKSESLAVGDSFYELGGEPVIAILQEPAEFAICTFHRGGVEGEPFRIPFDTVNAVEEFEN